MNVYEARAFSQNFLAHNKLIIKSQVTELITNCIKDYESQLRLSIVNKYKYVNLSYGETICIHVIFKDYIVQEFEKLGYKVTHDSYNIYISWL